MMYFYKLYGLVVKSGFVIPEAYNLPIQKDWDVEVELGTPPKEVLEHAYAGKICGLDKLETWFYLKDLGLFYIKDGKKIIIHKESECLTDLSRNSYLTGTAMGLLLFQRDIIPFHSSGVAKNGKCIAIAGCSGAGKSTISLKLREKGCDFVTDDVSAISIQEGVLMVSPSLPQQKVCKDAAIRMGYQLEELIYIDEFRDKYAVRLQKGYMTDNIPLAAILELEIVKGDKVEIQEITGLKKLQLLFRNIYRGYALNEIGMSPVMHNTLVQIAKIIPMYQIKRPTTGYHTEYITDWIIEHMEKI